MKINAVMTPYDVVLTSQDHPKVVVTISKVGWATVVHSENEDGASKVNIPFDLHQLTYTQLHNFYVMALPHLQSDHLILPR